MELSCIYTIVLDLDKTVTCLRRNLQSLHRFSTKNILPGFLIPAQVKQAHLRMAPVPAGTLPWLPKDSILQGLQRGVKSCLVPPVGSTKQPPDKTEYAVSNLVAGTQSVITHGEQGANATGPIEKKKKKEKEKADWSLSTSRTNPSKCNEGCDVQQIRCIAQTQACLHELERLNPVSRVSAREPLCESRKYKGRERS